MLSVDLDVALSPVFQLCKVGHSLTLVLLQCLCRNSRLCQVRYLYQKIVQNVVSIMINAVPVFHCILWQFLVLGLIICAHHSCRYWLSFL